VLTSGVLTTRILGGRMLAAGLVLHQSGHDDWGRWTWPECIAVWLPTAEEWRWLVWQGIWSEVAIWRHNTRWWLLLVASPAFIELVGGFV